MKKFLVSTILLAAVWAGKAQAEVLTLDSCVQMALRNNREIKASQLRTQEQQQTEKAYRANYFPDFSAQGLYFNSFSGEKHLNLNLLGVLPPELQVGFPTYRDMLAALASQFDPALGQIIGQMDGKVKVGYKLNNIYYVGLSMKQPLYMGGKITTAHRMSKIGTDMARLNEALTHDQVIVQTHEAYSLLLQATEMYEVAQQYDSLLAQLICDVENAERHGLRGHNDVLKVQVKKNEAELQVVQAHNATLLAQMNLCRCIGMPLGTEVKVAEVKEEAQLPSTQSGNVIARPDYNLLELKSELAQQKVKLVRSDFMPQLGVQLSGGYLHGGELMGNTLFNSNSPGVAAMVSLSVPIWHGNEASHKVKAAKLEHERTLLEQEELVEKMQLELQQAANRLDEAIVELELCRKGVAQAAENLRNSQRAFEVGLETLSDLLTAQTLWQQAKAKEAIAASQLMVSEVKYRKACGQL